MAKKIQLQDANGNVLHPLTLGECVAMDNGENLDTLMSKSQMFTPTITQDKSMFKVGTGIDVDYSANVKDGAYESLVFKGKTLKSLIDFKGKFQRTTGTLVESTQGAITFTTSGTGKFNLGCKLQLKPNTKYLLRAKTTSAYDVNMFVLDVDKNAYIMGHTAIPSATEIAVTFTTTDSITDNINFSFSRQITQGNETITGQAMIVECDDSMEMNDIPLFEGLCDSKMPILRNVGKNLINESSWNIHNTVDGYECLKFDGYASPTGVSLGDKFVLPVSIKKGRTYTVKCKNKATVYFNKFIFITDIVNGKPLSIITPVINHNKTNFVDTIFTFTAQSDYRYFHIDTGDSNCFGYVVKNTLQIEESPIATSYEDHKTNILRTSEEIVLCEVNGVQDAYDPLTGEYVRRIGEIVLDGSQALSLDGSLVYLGLTDRPINNFGIADKIPVITVNQLVTGEFGICMQDRGVSGRIYINIEGLTTREEILQHLRTNPITIHYGLVEPVTTIIKPSTMTPFAYQNGHVIVESGFEGQSLLPEIEYSVVTGRTGQVTQNTKVLRQQEQQIIGLEELLLTQIVQMEYERTLLQFDYELQMMMLG